MLATRTAIVNQTHNDQQRPQYIGMDMGVTSASGKSAESGLIQTKTFTTQNRASASVSVDSTASNDNFSPQQQQRSWRSTGWKPLVYPSLALYEQEEDLVVSTSADVTRSATTASGGIALSANTTKLNPFFPLHKDVVSATIRELLILDGVLDSSTLDVIRLDEGTTKNDPQEPEVKSAKNENKKEKDIYKLESPSISKINKGKSKGKLKTAVKETEKSKKSKSKNLPRKRKRGTKLPTKLNHPTQARTMTKVLEDLIRIDILQQKNEEHDDDGISEKYSNHISGEDLVAKLRQIMVDRINSTPTSDDKNSRVRKVSDVDVDNNPTPTIHNASAAGALDTNAPPFAAHLAVAAINGHGQTIDIESSIQQVLHGNNIEMGDDPQENQEKVHALIFDQHLQQDLPPLLDLSIMVEAYLRQIALGLVRALEHCISEKALREFLGYKSPTAKSEKVLELISDFLFDVSHAMFAWEKTENDMFGMASGDNNMQDIHDSTIRKTLFDNRALRKIGGFEPTSLLHHALSIKRLRLRGETWQHFSKTVAGKKMFLHHKDNLARVQAGAKRRDKRMKKNLSVCYPIHVNDERDKARSRSSSFASVESGTNPGGAVQGTDLKVSTTDSHSASMPCNSPTFPDLIPITISREVEKSWGILLAKEGSMCVVMRVPDDKDTSLRRGDLIVSIRNECDQCVNTPTLHPSSQISPEWFSEAVGMFKRSNTLHLDVRRVSSAV